MALTDAPTSELLESNACGDEAERLGDTIARVIDGLYDELGLSAEERLRVLPRLERELRRLEHSTKGGTIS